MAKISSGGRALSKNEKTLLGILCAAALFFIINSLVIEPNNKKIKPLKEEVSQLKAQVENISNLDSSIKVKEKELKDLKSEFEEATKSIPKTDRYPQVIKDLEGIASSSNVSIASYSLSLPTTFANQQSSDDSSESTNTSKGLQTFNVQIQLNGAYTDVLTFINKLESDSRIKEVVNLSSTKDSSNINILYYVAGTIDVEDYDFNNGEFGKENPFN